MPSPLWLVMQHRQPGTLRCRREGASTPSIRTLGLSVDNLLRRLRLEPDRKGTRDSGEGQRPAVGLNGASAPHSAGAAPASWRTAIQNEAWAMIPASTRTAPTAICVNP